MLRLTQHGGSWAFYSSLAVVVRPVLWSPCIPTPAGGPLVGPGPSRVRTQAGIFPGTGPEAGGSTGQPKAGTWASRSSFRPLSGYRPGSMRLGL